MARFVSVLVFARRGLAATKIADIAAAGEMSQGLIYRYFTSKEEIYAAVLERAMQSTLRIGREASESEGSSLEKLRWLLQYVIDGLWSHSELALVVQDMLMNQAMPQEIRAPAFEQAIAFQQIIYRLIAEAQAVGQVSSSNDPMMLTMLVGACLQGLTTQKMYLRFCMCYTVHLPERFRWKWALCSAKPLVLEGRPCMESRFTDMKTSRPYKDRRHYALFRVS